MSARELGPRRSERPRAGGDRSLRRLAVTLARSVIAAVTVSALVGAPVHAQQRVPAGWDEGLFDVAAAGLPQSSISVLVTPRGKFLLPVREVLDPLAVPYRIAPDSGVMRVSRPGGVGTASLWWTGSRRLEVVATTPLDSDDVQVDGTRVFVAANRLAELIEGAI